MSVNMKFMIIPTDEKSQRDILRVDDNS